MAWWLVSGLRAFPARNSTPARHTWLPSAPSPLSPDWPQLPPLPPHLAPDSQPDMARGLSWSWHVAYPGPREVPTGVVWRADALGWGGDRSCISGLLAFSLTPHSPSCLPSPCVTPYFCGNRPQVCSFVHSACMRWASAMCHMCTGARDLNGTVAAPFLLPHEPPCSRNMDRPLQRARCSMAEQGTSEVGRVRGAAWDKGDLEVGKSYLCSRWKLWPA